jgi:glycosyltransferase involved in cell wall biosynthesis
MTALRVVQVVRSGAYAGVEQYIASVAPLLASRGCSVRVVGGDPARMTAALGRVVEHVAAATTPAVIRALSAGGRADIVHSHMTAAEVAAVVSRPRHHAHVVATRHFSAPRGANPLTRPILALLARTLSAEVAISDFVAESVGAGCRVIPNGVAVQEVSDQRDRTVLVLQRFEPEKQTALALRAWAASGLAQSGWRLLMAGSGSEESALRALARELAIEDSVEWLGYLNDAGSHLAAAGMVLATTPAEGFGLAVVEAMARGTPVVAADGGAHRETLGPDGVFFVPGETTGAVEALRELAADDDRRASYGTSLHDRQRQLFDIEMHVDRLLELYGECVSGRS